MRITITKEMQERADVTGGTWNHEGNGYFSLIGSGMMGQVAYISLPKGHKLIGKDYDAVEEINDGVNVNGGLTYGNGNIFGWDYAHASNDMNIAQHIKNAIKFFKENE
jgi:hypothetical protein